MKRIWFDFTNTPHVHFLMAIKKMITIEETDFIYTARDFSETKQLLDYYINSRDYLIINSSYGKSTLSKAHSIFSRFNKIRKNVSKFDLSLSCGSESAIWLSKMRGKKSMAFGDNDTAKQWTYGYAVDYAFFPDAIPTDILERQGLKKKLYQYHGYKEDIYISYFIPDDNFLNLIPFKNYIVVRPENIHANYLNNSSVQSITPQLLQGLSKKGYNIVYLPRYLQDKDYCNGIKNVFTPEKPLNGLDLCYHADAVLTGAGTLAREAACMGIPSFSFYAGTTLLAVDKKLISQKKVFYSRDPFSIIDELKRSTKNNPEFSRSKEVREELGIILNEKILL